MIKSFATTLILISGTLASQQFNARTAATDLKNETVDCLPNSDEYYRRIDALVCDEDYVEDVSDAIEKSTCINYFYTEENYYRYHYFTEECVPLIDNRTNVDNCSDECSLRQKYYYYCTYLWEKELDINMECGYYRTNELGRCTFNEKDFCKNQENLIYRVLDVCGYDEDTCSVNCQYYVEDFKQKSGCCVYSFIGPYLFTVTPYYNERLRNLFFECDVDIPERCSSSSPPRDFLECAGLSAGTITAPFYIATVIMMVIGLM